MQNNNKELLDKIITLQEDTDKEVKMPFNLRSVIFIVMAIVIGIIAALAIVFCIVYFL